MLSSHNNTVIYLKEVAGQIDAEDVSTLDFDRLRSTLLELAAFVETVMPQSNELNLLRKDLEGRIAGMEKAIAVARRGESQMRQALTRIEMLPSLSAAELIEAYRHAGARFRDCFPTSFGPSVSSRRQSDPDISQYK